MIYYQYMYGYYFYCLDRSYVLLRYYIPRARAITSTVSVCIRLVVTVAVDFSVLDLAVCCHCFSWILHHEDSKHSPQITMSLPE